MSPQLRTEPARLEAESPDPGTHEYVRDRIAVADGKGGLEVPLIELPHRSRPRRLYPQHSPRIHGAITVKIFISDIGVSIVIRRLSAEEPG
jgi:hypothetical protein